MSSTRVRVGAFVRALFIFAVLAVGWLAAAGTAQAESAPPSKRVEVGVRCLLYQQSAVIDCTPYEAFFKAVDTDCKRWVGIEAYLAVRFRSEDGLSGFDKLNCRKASNPPGVNSGWEGGLRVFSSELRCEDQTWTLQSPGICVRADPSASCRAGDGAAFGNPIFAPTAEKIELETDFEDAGPHPLSFKRSYRSAPSRAIVTPQLLGSGWAMADQLNLSRPSNGSMTLVAGDRVHVFADRGNGYEAVGGLGRIDKNAAGFVWKRNADDALVQFSADGRVDTVAYAANTSVVIDPLGTLRNYEYRASQGQLVIGSASMVGSQGSRDAQSRVQDASGLVTSETDFTGVRTDYTWNTARRLPLTITKAAGTPQAQVTRYDWHPVFSLPILVTEAERTTAFEYDAQGNLLSQSIAAAAGTTAGTTVGPARRTQWTYDPQGLVASRTDPNGARTTYTYDPFGNPILARNALGHETRASYDAANRIASLTEPNGLLTRYTWDARDRLLSVERSVGTGSGFGTDAPQLTRFSYKPTGSLDSIRLPSGHVVTYLHDAAHRLIGWSDNRGSRHAFTLDAIGNRIAERLTDARGDLVWSAARSVNAINRIAAATEGSNQTTTFGYDPNGERIAETNGLNQSTRLGLDPLRRVRTITDATNASASLDYDSLDAITEARDFKGVATRFQRDAEGNAIRESSPDIGSLHTQRDLLGLPAHIVDALGQATTIERDLLGRPVSIRYADGNLTTLAYDLDPASRGWLSRIGDRSGVTHYTRDGFGRVIRKHITLASGFAQTVGYRYHPSGQLAELLQPSGSVLGYHYDATGQLLRIDQDGVALVTDLRWNALGQPTGWTWPFAGPQGLTARRSYDSAGRLTATESSNYYYDRAGRISLLAQQLYKPSDADPT